MPPAPRSVLYGLPTVFRIPYLLIAFVVLSGIPMYMRFYDIGDEGDRVDVLVILLIVVINFYFFISEKYAKKYGSVEVDNRGRPLKSVID